MNPRDKMPLEVTPIYFKLQRYDASKVKGAAPADQPAAQPAVPAAENPPPAENPQPGR
jgi:hypothetical protein